MSDFVIIRGKLSGKEIKFNSKDSSRVIKVTFNPTEYSIKKDISFNEPNIPGLISPVIQFTQGKAQTLNVELMLDTQVSDKSEKKDIRKEYIEKLQKLMEIDSDLHAPPPCQVLWGSLKFNGVLENMDKKYILFSSDGKPVRARVTLSFKEYIPLKLQVKKSPNYSPDRRKLFKMNEGDSIWQMAYEAYGDAGLWREIAEANKIDDPLRIKNGSDLIIPVLN
jgi:nucleoid-associated protein YgaU